MRTLHDLGRQSLAGLRVLAVLTIILGVLFPLAIWGASFAFHDRATGQLIRVDGQVVGSALIAQPSPSGISWFQPRPSAVDYDGLGSGASNLGPSNPELIAQIDQRRTAIAAQDGVSPEQVPADALTASASGLDPDISPAYAQIQVARVAAANNLPTQTVADLVAAHTAGRMFGLLGEPTVNVLTLNIAVQAAAGAH
ncbi:potassium-transporting ATPase subunit KdpC [Tomitella biformata]|uniref:potassium-transporting ATPase subunit KdpC n=1 Tax=Tomitella biformata TaxID=630403 RepID=UPI0004AF10E7|nr:potassium-transporting ATPase subunit KdpC [Tomitella biformata]